MTRRRKKTKGTAPAAAPEEPPCPNPAHRKDEIGEHVKCFSCSPIVLDAEWSPNKLREMADKLPHEAAGKLLAVMTRRFRKSVAAGNFMALMRAALIYQATAQRRKGDL